MRVEKGIYDDDVERYEAFAFKCMKFDEAHTIFFALAEYRDRLVDDLATQYGGRETIRETSYSLEDEVFLVETLAKVTTLMMTLHESKLFDFDGGRAHRYRQMTPKELVAKYNEEKVN